MDDNARDLAVEDRLKRLGVHWHWEDAVPLAEIAPDPNPARWEKRFDPLHRTAIGCAMIDGKPVPAFLLYRPPGATRYLRLGGTHRFEACKEAKIDRWPGYVIDQPLDEFLIEALPIYDNTDHGKGYTKDQRLAFAAHLFKFDDRKPEVIAKALGLTVKEIHHHIDMLAVLNRAHDLHISTEAKRVPEYLQVEVNKTFPGNDMLFKAVIETLAFTERVGHAAKSLIHDVQHAKTEAAAVDYLKDIYEARKAELERLRRGGKKKTPTAAARYKKHAVALETAWPGRLELMEITSHEDGFIEELLSVLKSNLPKMQEVIDRCAEVLTMRATSRAERLAAD